MDIKKIGNFINFLRNKKGLTQEQLARKINVTNKAISKWERGVGLPDISLLKPLSKELNVTVHELLNGEFDNKDNKTNSDEINQILNIIKVKTNNSYKKIILLIISLLTFVALLIYLYVEHNKKIYDSSYFLELIEHVSLIPFLSINSYIKNGYQSQFSFNIALNILAPLLIMISFISFKKLNKHWLKILFLTNTILEIIKWLLLIGVFDIDDIIIRTILTYTIFLGIKKSLEKAKKYLAIYNKTMD